LREQSEIFDREMRVSGGKKSQSASAAAELGWLSAEDAEIRKGNLRPVFKICGL
jgi:hypothetical protein